MAEANLVGTVDGLGLGFEIRWESRVPAGTADEATRGEVSAFLDGAQVWVDRTEEAPRGVAWSMVELLEHLSRAWPYLGHEEADPLGLCVRPDSVRAEAERRWEALPREQRVHEQRDLAAFEDTHDLSRAFQGMWLPSLWVMRQGRLCWLVSGATAVMRPFDAVTEALARLGQLIASRLRGLEDARARTAVLAWDERARLDPVFPLEVATGFSPATLRETSGGADVLQFFEWSEGRSGSELAAVARMTGACLDPATLAVLLDRVRRETRAVTTLLDTWSAAAHDALGDSASCRAFDQGYALARWFRREVLAVPDRRRVDPERALKESGVGLGDIEIPAASLDSVSVWGERHGPAVLVNRKGRHGTGRGRRATLAHELCHLLVDRTGALPLAEVLGGRVDSTVEARARAFAAELLVPRSAAGAAFLDGAPSDTLDRLTRQYGASREIVAWQARNSEVALPARARAFLRGQVSTPERF